MIAKRFFTVLTFLGAIGAMCGSEAGGPVFVVGLIGYCMCLIVEWMT